MSESITSREDAVRKFGALPVPAGPERLPLSDERLAVLRKLRTHCEADAFESEEERPPHVWGPSQYPKREMCQRCTVSREWAEDGNADEVVLVAEVDRLRSRVAELESERHVTNESLSEAAEALRVQRDRIAELEAQREADHQTWQHDLRTARDEREATAIRIAELEKQVRLLNTQRGDVAQLIEREGGHGEECVDIDDLTAALGLGSDELGSGGVS